MCSIRYVFLFIYRIYNNFIVMVNLQFNYNNKNTILNYIEVKLCHLYHIGKLQLNKISLEILVRSRAIRLLLNGSNFRILLFLCYCISILAQII